MRMIQIEEYFFEGIVVDFVFEFVFFVDDMFYGSFDYNLIWWEINR